MSTLPHLTSSLIASWVSQCSSLFYTHFLHFVFHSSQILPVIPRHRIQCIYSYFKLILTYFIFILHFSFFCFLLSCFFREGLVYFFLFVCLYSTPPSTRLYSLYLISTSFYDYSRYINIYKINNLKLISLTLGLKCFTL